MSGGLGDDVLIGSAADDFMVGGILFDTSAGVDQFKFGTQWGNDTIQDFEDGVERIDLSASGLSFADLTIEDPFGFGDRTLISSSAGSITVTGVPPSAITEGDFIFA
jgi:Ca2+-binding RTX toxin-like protein